MPSPTFYDAIGTRYTTTRREDPRIRSAIHAALGDARTLLNVGAGAGSYEPRDREVTALDPSPVMIAHRPSTAAPAVLGRAESLPFDDSSFDAVMAVLSDHHWEDRARGMRELCRVARRRVVLFTWDQRLAQEFWLTRDYLPAFTRLPRLAFEDLAECCDDLRTKPFPIPHDCRDGFYHAFWRRPEAYLEEQVRAGISVFARLGDADIATMVSSLRADLQSGKWKQRNASLLELEELDLGYRVVIAEFASGG
jgi:SAM-dependent methyltransferase